MQNYKKKHLPLRNKIDAILMNKNMVGAGGHNAPPPLSHTVIAV